MWRNWRDSKKEGLLVCDSIFKKAVGLVGKDIGRVFALVADRDFMIALETGIEILVSVWVKEEVRAGETFDERCVVCLQAMSVE